MAYFSSSIYSALVSVTGGDPGFVGPESYTSLGPSLRITETKLGTKSNTYLERENE